MIQRWAQNSWTIGVSSVRYMITMSTVRYATHIHVLYLQYTYVLVSDLRARIPYRAPPNFPNFRILQAGPWICVAEHSTDHHRHRQILWVVAPGGNDARSTYPTGRYLQY
jgi:hypothetical protein